MRECGLLSRSFKKVIKFINKIWFCSPRGRGQIFFGNSVKVVVRFTLNFSNMFSLFFSKRYLLTSLTTLRGFNVVFIHPNKCAGESYCVWFFFVCMYV